MCQSVGSLTVGNSPGIQIGGETVQLQLVLDQFHGPGAYAPDVTQSLWTESSGGGIDVKFAFTSAQMSTVTSTAGSGSFDGDFTGDKYNDPNKPVSEHLHATWSCPG
jgi:hypothetical protein